MRNYKDEIIPITGRLLFLPDVPEDKAFPMNFQITEDDLVYFDAGQYNNTAFRVPTFLVVKRMRQKIEIDKYV